jgi:glycosyltransferase involved in cell wall biosynthesis
MLARAIGWPPPESELYRVGRILEGTSLRLADAVYSSSACSIEWCAREHGLDTRGWPVLHAGVDTIAFAPGPAERPSFNPDGRPTVLFVGKIVPNKGALVLVDACARLADRIPGLRLRLLGGGEPAWVREAEARAAGVPGLLELPGFVPRERLPEELRRADVFAAPSLYEGGPGFVYLEAMACGLPVVACSGSGVEEAVTEDCGILVPPGDVGALAAALGRLLEEPALRRRMGERGRERALAVDTHRCVPRIEAFFQQVVREAATKAGAC